MAELAQYRLQMEKTKIRYKERYKTDETFRASEKIRINETNKKRYANNPEVKASQKIRSKISYEKRKIKINEQKEYEKLKKDDEKLIIENNKENQEIQNQLEILFKSCNIEDI